MEISKNQETIINGETFSLYKGRLGESITNEATSFTWAERNSTERATFTQLRRFFDNPQTNK